MLVLPALGNTVFAWKAVSMFAFTAIMFRPPAVLRLEVARYSSGKLSACAESLLFSSLKVGLEGRLLVLLTIYREVLRPVLLVKHPSTQTYTAWRLPSLRSTLSVKPTNLSPRPSLQIREAHKIYIRSVIHCSHIPSFPYHLAAIVSCGIEFLILLLPHSYIALAESKPGTSTPREADASPMYV